MLLLYSLSLLIPSLCTFCCCVCCCHRRSRFAVVLAVVLRLIVDAHVLAAVVVDFRPGSPQIITSDGLAAAWHFGHSTAASSVIVVVAI